MENTFWIFFASIIRLAIIPSINSYLKNWYRLIIRFLRAVSVEAVFETLIGLLLKEVLTNGIDSGFFLLVSFERLLFPLQIHI